MPGRAVARGALVIFFFNWPSLDRAKLFFVRRGSAKGERLRVGSKSLAIRIGQGRPSRDVAGAEAGAAGVAPVLLP